MDHREYRHLPHNWERKRDSLLRDGEVVPSKFEVCPKCEGNGKFVNPSIDSHGISAQEFAEDPDFAEQYFSGVFDKTCDECGGLRVVLMPIDRTIFDQDMEEYMEHLRELDFERRMGC